MSLHNVTSVCVCHRVNGCVSRGRVFSFTTQEYWEYVLSAEPEGGRQWFGGEEPIVRH